MDEWFSEENYTHSSCSSASLPESFFDAFLDLPRFDSVAEFARDEGENNHLDLGDELQPKNYDCQQLYQTSVQTDVRNQSQFQDRSSSSSSELASPNFQNFDLQNLILKHSERDEAAITKAMMAVISDSDASQINYDGHQRRLGVFNPYNSYLIPQVSSKKKIHGQKTIKAATSMTRRIDRVSEAAASEFLQTPNQQYHSMSERRRREKLNESLDVLRSMLHPQCKTDKASVLVIAKDYLNTLKAQVSDLEAKNRTLELQLPPPMDANNYEDRVRETSNRVDVRVFRSAEPQSGMHDIDLEVAVRMECDVIQVALRILECLKKMTIIRLVSLDANSYLPRMCSYASVSLTLRLKASYWDEEWFKENITRAVDNSA